MRSANHAAFEPGGQIVRPVVEQLLPLALTVAFTTVPIVVTLVVLVNFADAIRGWMVTAGYAVGLIIVLGAFTFGFLRIPAPSGNSTIIATVELVAGAALLTLGIIRIVRRKHQPRRVSSTPRLIAGLHHLSKPRSFALGLSFAVHPENLLLCAAASARILAGNIAFADRAFVIVGFAIVGVSTVAIPTAMYAVSADRVKPAMERAQNWLTRNSHSVTSIVLVVVGAVLIGAGGLHFVTAAVA
jgi:uncharacterized membrane protein YidH (DUF202 family)